MLTNYSIVFINISNTGGITETEAGTRLSAAPEGEKEELGVASISGPFVDSNRALH